MTEWLLLLLLVPAIVVPVVLLFGFAGCRFEPGRAPPDGPILTATPKGPRLIELDVDEGAGRNSKNPVRTDHNGRPAAEPAAGFILAGSFPAVYPDSDRLFPATPYTYKARAVLADGGKSQESSVDTMTPALEVTFDATGTGSTGTRQSREYQLASYAIGYSRGRRRGPSVDTYWRNGSPTRTVTYGGTTMTSLGVIGLNNEALTNLTGTYHEFFGLLNPPTGAQTVSVVVSRNLAIDIGIEGCSVSYAGVSTFDPVPPVFGTEAGTSLSQTVGSAAHEMVVQMFTTASGAITGYNKTVRFDGGPNGPAIGDAPGDASVSFTASRDAGVDYAGLAVRLIPG